MNLRLGMSLALCGALAWSVALASAQEAPPPPPPQDVLYVGAGGDPMGGFVGTRIQLLGFEGLRGGKVVTGAPFSATAVTETTQTLADGNHITRTVQTNLFRDSQGRVRREVTLPAIGPLAAAGQTRSFIFISDPVAGTSYILHPDTKTADQLPKPFAGGKGPLRAMAEGKMQAWQQKPIAQGNLNREDLGAQTIGGVNAQGTRITHVIPAGQIGNEKPITVVSERWYSNDLQTMVMSKRSDPRFGNTTYTLTNIQRSEPNASLFTVPPGYTVTQGGPGKGPGGGMMRRFNQAPPPPAPPGN